MFSKRGLIALTSLVLLISFVSAQNVGYGNVLLPKVSSPTSSSSGSAASSNSSFNQTFADARYWKLAFDNIHSQDEGMDGFGFTSMGTSSYNDATRILLGEPETYIGVELNSDNAITYKAGISNSSHPARSLAFEGGDNNAYNNSAAGSLFYQAGNMGDPYDGDGGSITAFSGQGHGVGYSSGSITYNVPVPSTGADNGHIQMQAWGDIILYDSINGHQLKLNSTILALDGSNMTIDGSKVCTSANGLCGTGSTFNLTYNRLLNQSCPAGKVVNGTLSNGTFICTTVASSNANIFDQVLNTTSNVTFNNITVTQDVVIGGIAVKQWLYNQTIVPNFTNVAFLNNSETFTNNQTINSSLILNDDSNKSFLVQNSSGYQQFVINGRTGGVGINMDPPNFTGSTGRDMEIGLGRNAFGLELTGTYNSFSPRIISASPVFNGTAGGVSPGFIVLDFRPTDQRIQTGSSSNDVINWMYFAPTKVNAVSQKTNNVISLIDVGYTEGQGGFSNYTSAQANSNYNLVVIGSGLQALGGSGGAGSMPISFNYNGTGAFAFRPTFIDAGMNIIATNTSNGTITTNYRFAKVQAVYTGSGDSQFTILHGFATSGFNKTWFLANEIGNSNNYLGGNNIKNYRGNSTGTIELRNLQGAVFDMYNGSDWIYGADNLSSNPKLVIQNFSSLLINTNLTIKGTNLNINNATNSISDRCTLVSGVCTIANTQVTANTNIFCFEQTQGGTIGSIGINARNAGVNYTISSSNILDTSVVACELHQPSG